MPTRRFYQLAAFAASVAVANSAARAVIFHSTGDPTFNTTAPTGTLANSGWQYQFQLGQYLGTPVGPRHYVTAAHTGAGPGWAFNYNGLNYTTTKVAATHGDLRLFEVDKTFHSYAPLYDLAPESEQGEQVVMIGRGTRRGSEIRIGGVLKGWHWGAIDGVQRWGTNNVAGFANDSTLMRVDFDPIGGNEAVLSDKDSGGAMFIKVGSEWRLAGINMAVTGPYSIPPDTDEFVAALFDTSGMVNHQTDPDTSGAGPSGAYASMVSPHAADIKNFLNLPPTWKTDADGQWSEDGNWANGDVPDAVDAVADFRTAIGGARTVTFPALTDVGTINFDSPHGYTLVPLGSSGQLRLDVSSGNATVNVASGSHEILTSLRLNDPTTFNVIPPSSTLTAGISVAFGQAITKQGQGTLAVRRLISGAVTVSQGTLRVNANGTSSRTSKVDGLTVATGAGAKFDLTDNDLIVTNTPVGAAASGGTYAGLSGLIQQAHAGGAWTGPGLTSSNAATTGGLTTLGIARAGDVLDFGSASTTTWSGQTVSAGDALVAYTYAGDANLDGVITGDDYSAIDFNIAVPGASGYANGDFNYDGIISGDDYSVIDFTIVAQGAALISSAPQVAGAAGISAVPEPAATSLVAFASVALLSRRRHRSR